jgi:hypothetical protein
MRLVPGQSTCQICGLGIVLQRNTLSIPAMVRWQLTPFVRFMLTIGLFFLLSIVLLVLTLYLFKNDLLSPYVAAKPTPSFLELSGYHYDSALEARQESAYHIKLAIWALSQLGGLIGAALLLRRDPWIARGLFIGVLLTSSACACQTWLGAALD